MSSAPIQRIANRLDLDERIAPFADRVWRPGSANAAVLNLEVVSAIPFLVDIDGVGYGLNISLNTFDNLPAEGTPISLHTYTYVREDRLQLFGFSHPAEREMFELQRQLLLTFLASRPSA